jgi:AcrR family transcriptional regulator
MFRIPADEQQDARQAILAAARELLAAGSDLSMRALARRIGCSPGTIYLYVRNKSELLRHLAEENVSRLTDLLDGLRDRHRHGDPVVLLKKGLYTCVEFQLRHPEQYDTTLKQPVPIATLQEFVTRCIREGILRSEVDPEAACISLCAAIHGLTSMLIAGAFQAERATVIEQVINTSVDGLVERSSNPRARAASVA